MLVVRNYYYFIFIYLHTYENGVELHPTCLLLQTVAVNVIAQLRKMIERCGKHPYFQHIPSYILCPVTFCPISLCNISKLRPNLITIFKTNTVLDFLQWEGIKYQGCHFFLEDSNTFKPLAEIFEFSYSSSFLVRAV